MRYRDGILKVEHGILPGLRDELLGLTSVEGVTSIVPGRIYAVRGRRGGGLHLRVSAPTATGLKLIARRGSAVQEVFIVCTSQEATEAVRRLLR